MNREHTPAPPADVALSDYWLVVALCWATWARVGSSVDAALECRDRADECADLAMVWLAEERRSIRQSAKGRSPDRAKTRKTEA